MALKKSQRSLKSWTKQKWRTKSGKKSSETGERYLPSAAIKALTPAEYAARELERANNMLSSQKESQPKPEDTDEQLEFKFEKIKRKKEKERKRKLNLPDNPLDELLKDKK